MKNDDSILNSAFQGAKNGIEAQSLPEDLFASFGTEEVKQPKQIPPKLYRGLSELTVL